jgi:SAM-dependent methyltransferase
MLGKYWQKLNQETIGTKEYWTIAVQNYSIYKDTKNLIKNYIFGRTLDIGAGSLAWKTLLNRSAAKYNCSDYSVTHKDLDMVFDVTKPFPVKSNSYDSLFCHSVLEHTPEPWKAFDEFHRILKKNGVLLISVPFIFYVHGAPYDFFRFTKYGMVQLAEKAGFKVEKLVLSGGMMHFLFNMPSVVLSTLLFAVHLSFLIKPLTKMLTFIASLFDTILDRQKIFTMNIVLVLRKT